MKKNDKKWSLPDIVDYEYFLAENESATSENASDTARKWFLDTKMGFAASAPRILLKKWLEWRKTDQNVPKNTPGAIFRLTDRFIIIILMVFGTFLGFGIAQGVLFYTGKQAINLFICYGLLVALPLLMSVVSVLSVIWRKTHLGDAIGTIFRLKLEWLYRQISRFFSGKQILAQKAVSGFLQTRVDLYRALPGWFLMLRLQLLALFCQFGIFLAVFLRGWVADLAFAWQSTAKIDPQTIYNLAYKLSFGWRWLVAEPLANPTLSQVAGSQVTLKDGLAGLTNSDLTAWWPFLCWSILFYAVLPRLILFTIAWTGEVFALKRVAFDDMASRKLIRSLTATAVSIDNETLQPDEEPSAAMATGHINKSQLNLPCTLLIPDECINLINNPKLKAGIEAHLQITIQYSTTVVLDEDEDRALLHQLSKEDQNLIMVLEGWKPCLESDLHYLRVLRKTIGTRLLFVALTGRPIDAQNFTTLDNDHFKIWSQRLATLSDPYLDVFVVQAPTGDES